MRLSDRDRTVIKAAILKHFGDGATVRLFGSRTDDSRRGGDIDLLVKSKLTGREALRAKIGAITDIQLALGDQKIDMVIDNYQDTSDGKNQPLILANARREGVSL